MPKKSDRSRDLAGDISSLVRKGTGKWTKTRKAEERSPASRSYRMSRMTREHGISVKEAAAQIMPSAYMKASGNGAFPANARQIMYCARGHIQNITGRQLEPNYFTQTLLPDYMNENEVDWDVVYDARGHFTEPHSKHSFGIGTLEVRDYIARSRDPSFIEAGISQAKVETSGPSGNYGAILFVEKEGFTPLFKAAQIAEKYDIAVMSTKGMSVTASRALVDELCSDHDIPLLLLHDFDKAGFSIAGTLQRDTRRYEYRNDIEVIDLGLSVADVEAMELESEYQHHPKASKSALIANLRDNGASVRDITFMFRDFDEMRSTRRVELNAMTSPQFVAFIERKLAECGIGKVVPEEDRLVKAYGLFARSSRVEELVEAALQDEDDTAINVPSDLSDQVRSYLKKHPEKRWERAVEALIDDEVGGR